MRLTSLRSKIFLLVGLTLLFSAALVMVLTQRSVTQTVSAMEEHAVYNVLNLLVQDSEARWGGFLNDKIATVRSNRARLLQHGQTIHSVLQAWQQQVRSGEVSDARARELALEWLSSLNSLEQSSSKVWVFDPTRNVLATGYRLSRNLDVATLLDYKGRPLAESVYQEVRVSGSAFAIYRLPDLGSDTYTLRYAYFSYLPDWEWVVGVSDDAEGIVQQFDRRRRETEDAIAEVLHDLRLAESGFAFIIGDDGHLVAPPPSRHVGLLGATDDERGRTLQGMLHSLPPASEIQQFSFRPSGQKDAWRIYSTHFKPLGWTIVAAVPEADFTRAATELRNQLGVLLLLVLAGGLIVAGMVSLRMTRPLHQLSEFARALPEQDLAGGSMLPAHIAELPRRRPDEVGRLASAFAYMDEQLREKVARLLEETSSRQRLESELNIAQEIQLGLLRPPTAPELRGHVDLRATMDSAKEVGGDLYDYLLLPDGRLLFAIGDVSDKGMPAALFMAGTCTLIRALAETETDPAVIMTRINNLLSANNPNLMFVTLVIGTLDLGTGRLQWANAGHSPLCVLRPDGDLRMLEGRSGPACGVQEGLPYRLFEDRLDAGEVLIGYTDGVTEAVGPGEAQYGENRLYATLAPQAGCESAQVVDAIRADVREFVQDTPQSDDITLIAIKRLQT